MSQEQLLTWGLALVIIWGGISARIKMNQILCVYRRVNLQKVEKWVRIRDDHVVFDGAQFDVESDCLCPVYYNKGIHAFFPIWVMSLDYNYASRHPLNPRTLKINVVTPKVLKTMNNQGHMQAFNQSMPSQKKKQGLLEGWLPLIAIAIVIVGLWYMNQQNSALQTQIAAMRETLKSIVR